MDTTPELPTARLQIVGREREQAELRGALSRALEGHGGVVLIAGEAGIGKTALVREVIARADEAGMVILTAGCYDLIATPPYGPWIEILRAYSAEPGQPDAPESFVNPQMFERIRGQTVLLEEARRFVAGVAAERPLLIVLEDLHWADPATVEVLRYLARYLDTSPALIVCTYRIDEVDSRSAIVQQLPHLVRESRLVRIALQRLDRDDVVALVASRYRLVESDLMRLSASIWERSSGNPFFAVEILLGLEESRQLRPGAVNWQLGAIDHSPVPALLRQLIDARLERLDQASQAALQVASVIGQEVPFDLWRAVAGLDPVQLDRVIVDALEARLLESAVAPQAVQFRHAMFREALYASMPPGHREALHRRCGEALEAAPRPDPDLVAHQYRLAGDGRELEWLIRAGLRARSTAAFITAIERFERAAELLEGDTARTRERGWLLFYAVFLSRYHGELRPDQQLDEAERMALDAGDRVLGASIRFHRGLRFALQGRIRRGLEEFRAAVHDFEKLAMNDHVAHVDVLAPLVLRSLLDDDPGAAAAIDTAPSRNVPIFARSIFATWLSFAGNYREALDIGEPNVAEMIEALGEAHLHSIPGASGHFALGQTYAAVGRTIESRRELELARRAYELVGDSSMADVCVWSDLMLNVLPFMAEQPDERSRLVEVSDFLRSRNVSLARSVELASPGVVAVNLLEGRWDVAREQAERLASSYATPMIQSGTAQLGVIARNTGDAELAWRQVMALHPDGPETDPGDSYFPAAVQAQRLAAELALDAGDVDLAGAWIMAHARWRAWSGATLWDGEHLLLEARYRLAIDDLAGAHDAVDRALQHAATPRQALTLIAIQRLSGVIATREGRDEDARSAFATSRTIAESCGAPYERALTMAESAELAQRCSDEFEARQTLDAAREIAESLDAAPLLDRLRDIESRLRRQLAVHPDGLTGREVEILSLLAGGLSNARIAEQLRLSSRTVERHVANIYRKIGARNRAAATAYALSNDLN